MPTARQGTLLASKLLGGLLLGKGFDVKVSEVHGMSQRGYSPAQALQVDLGAGVALEVIAGGRILLVAGHAGDGVVQNDDGGIGLVIGHVRLRRGGQGGAGGEGALRHYLPPPLRPAEISFFPPRASNLHSWVHTPQPVQRVLSMA